MPPPEPRSSTVSPEVQVGDGDGIAASDAGQRRGVGHTAEVVVQAGTELVGLRPTTGCRASDAL